eukprot:CAMPEP_0185724416 /NCGR_PEP_ID=MMETSP1171-20130828/906_1 /TAXON_ID=374046 /ORGANISM="Helicotheca tamensis, Strain CCMP826" /LENGTH=404 /DNA_ID=CAMNT_0028392267 /DNA_START=33 /DNA_END=1247 /DNA_ORIENTATION=+
MKISALALSAVAILPRHIAAQTSCLGGSSFTVLYEGSCSYADLVERIAEEVTNDPTCTNTATQETNLLLSLSADATATAGAEAVHILCATAAAAEKDTFFPWGDITGHGEQFDKQYFDGNTFWNEEYETEVYNRVPYIQGASSNRLDIDARNVDDVYETVAEVGGIEFPDWMSNFAECDLHAVMCCWTADRQAGDNNGNCARPYDTNCVDADPGDNTDVCYVDMSRSSGSVHVDAGFALYDGDNDAGEGAAHCHGFAWANDETDPVSRYIGNNLFYVSMSDHMHDRGYVRNFPGAPMCACVDKMPVVTRSDCTQIDATETWSVDYDPSTGLSFELYAEYGVEIEFNSCQGGRGNDLEAHFKRLKNQGKVTQEQLDTLHETIVGNGNCPTARNKFVETMGFEVDA